MQTAKSEKQHSNLNWLGKSLLRQEHIKCEWAFPDATQERYRRESMKQIWWVIVPIQHTQFSIAQVQRRSNYFPINAGCVIIVMLLFKYMVQARCPHNWISLGNVPKCGMAQWIPPQWGDSMLTVLLTLPIRSLLIMFNGAFSVI